MNAFGICATTLALVTLANVAAAEESPVPEPAPEPTPAPTNTNDVTVAGTRVSRTPGSVHVIGEARLERYEHDDPHAVLQSVPGVYARGEDGVGLRPNIGIRGVNPDRSKKVALLEDGIPFAPAPYSASAAYYFPLITRMTAVRVLKGPAAIVYGPQTVGGAIDLVTRSIPGTTAGAADLAYGQFGYRKVHVHAGTSTEKVGFLVEGVHIGNDGFKELPNGADTGFVHNEWMVKGSWLVDPTAKESHEFRLKATYSDEVSNETYLGITDQDLRDRPNRRYGASSLDRMTWHRTALALSHVYQPNKDFTLTTTAYRNDLARTWRKVNGFRGADMFDVLTNPGTPRNAVFASILRGETDGASSGEAILIGPNQREFVSQGIETRARYQIKTGDIAHRIEYGARVHEDRVERRQSEDAFRFAGGELVPEGGPTVVTAFNEASTLAGALHAVDAMTWRGLTLSPGFRAEAMQSTFLDRDTGESKRQLLHVLLPGVGAFQSITKDLGALAGVYRGFSPPAPALGQRVEPELSVNYEGGARYSHGRSRVEAIGFYNDYSNMTDVCTQSSGCVDKNLDRQFDAGRARIYGAEVFGEHQLRLSKDISAPINLAYTLTQTAFLTTFKSDDPIFGDVKRGDEIPYVPMHQLSASVGVEHPRAGMNLAMTAVSKMREQAGSGPVEDALHTDDQVVFDVSGYIRCFENVVFYANVRNIGDSRYIVSRRPFGARPNAPRWAQVGLKITF